MTGYGDYGIISDEGEDRVYLDIDGVETDDHRKTHLMSEKEADKLCEELNELCGYVKYQVAIDICL